jgi:multiple sugar transport system permease protein
MKTGSDRLIQRTKFLRVAWRISRPVLIGVVLAIFLIPIGAMILTSFKTQGDALSWPPKILFKPTLENYRNIFALYPFADYLRNSVKVTLGSTALSLFFGLPAAYALARFPIRRKEDVALWFLSLRILPPIAVVIPFFIMLRNASLLDEPFGLMVIYLTFDIPFVVWVSRGFFREVPSELQDAALVDGCSEFGAFFRIALPLAKGGVAATAILTALFSWNEFMFALVLTSTERGMTMPVAVTLFIRETGIGWGNIGAAAVFMFLPMFILTLSVQRYIVSGLSLGAVK